MDVLAGQSRGTLQLFSFIFFTNLVPFIACVEPLESRDFRVRLVFPIVSLHAELCPGFMPLTHRVFYRCTSNIRTRQENPLQSARPRVSATRREAEAHLGMLKFSTTPSYIRTFVRSFAFKEPTFEDHTRMSIFRADGYLKISTFLLWLE